MVILELCRGIYLKGYRISFNCMFLTACFHNQISFSALIRSSQLLHNNSMVPSTVHPRPSDLISLSFSFSGGMYMWGEEDIFSTYLLRVVLKIN